MFNKDSRINKKKLMFFTLKILSLFFSAISFFQYIYDNIMLVTSSDYYGNVLSMIIGLVIIFVVMLLWISLSNKKIKQTPFLIIETIIFFAMFISAIYISGAEKSYYKFLFLFIIISSTMEHGIKPGLFIAAASSAIILGADIVFGGFGALNEYFQTDLALSAMFLIVAWTLGFYVRLENSHIEQLTEYANLDGLTGLYNHRYYHEYLEVLFDKSIEEKRDLSLLLFDIDYSKEYNDMCGHQMGDELLKEISAFIKSHLRTRDMFCRHGGDEFCVILPDTGKETAVEIAQRITDIVGGYHLDAEKFTTDVSLSVSIGVSSLDSETTSYTMLISNADTALYRAKFLRRNRIEDYSSIFDHFDTLDDDKLLSETLKSIKPLIVMINSRDGYTSKHVERVADYCRITADYLGLSKEDKKRLIHSAYLHDIGKINISKGILNAERNLTDEEWSELIKYPQYSANILSRAAGLDYAIPIVLQCHEKYDGTGYPAGLSGDNILYLARILAITESFDAMTNRRPYQKTKTFEEAFEELERCRHSQFDPILTDLFIEMLKSQ